MSKKNNTLNDLEEFLKLQASTLVTPPSLGKTEKAEPVRKAEPKKEKEVATTLELTDEELIEKVKLLARDKKDFYNLIISVTEGMPHKSSEDILLINTALYLRGGASWKEVIRDYWRSKK